MRQSEPGSLAISSADAPLETGTAPPSDRPGTPQRRHRYGRRRGLIPAGDAFVSRLGPASGEPFASLDDVDEGPPPARPTPDVPIEALRFAAIDCETTGQTPHRLVELGAIAFSVDRHICSFETLVHNNDRINPFARRLHLISSSLLAGAPRPEPVLRRFVRFAAGAVLVEHSADAFDTRLIGRTLGRPLDADSIDTSRLAAKLWDLRDTIGLERLCAELGVTHRRPHHALADAEATASCFLALLDRGRERFGWNTLGDLLRDGQPPPPRLAVVGAGRRHSVPADGDGSGQAEADQAPRRRRRRSGRRRRRPDGDGGAPGGEVDAAPDD
jgi:DNA polymerase III epsilon subunit-like protein